MGNHRAERSAPRRRPSVTRQQKYVGRRVAGRPGATAVLEPLAADAVEQVTPTPPAHAPEPVVRSFDPADFGLSESVLRVDEEPAATLDRTEHFASDDTERLPLVQAAPGKRRADRRRTKARGTLVRGLPSVPALVGVAAMAVSAGGAVLTSDAQLAGGTDQPRYNQASALTGASGIGRVAVRGPQVSRDGARDALADRAGEPLSPAAEAENAQREGALSALASSAEKFSAELAKNRWVAPLDSIVLTATFGQYGLWSSYHTGLDFNGNTGDPIKAVTNGTITFAGFDGAYGNKTVITTEDGTEIWLCHQTEIYVEVGETVRAGEIVGTVGTTGNVTGSHLHLEVRPGGGDPVDPHQALEVNGVDLP